MEYFKESKISNNNVLCDTLYVNDHFKSLLTFDGQQVEGNFTLENSSVKYKLIDQTSNMLKF